MTIIDQVTISRRKESNLKNIDFSDLPFGKIVADHMFSAEYVDGVWKNLRIEPYAALQMFPAMITLHYGQAIFEGLKAYRNFENEVILFRPDQNAIRFRKSAERLCMPPFPDELFTEAVSSLVDLDRAWVPPAEDGSLYIRPHMFATDEYIGVHPSHSYRFIIFTCPSGPYFNRPARIKIETKYARACSGGIGSAKAAANYAAALYPTKLAGEQGYDQVIWTDSKEHKYIEEAGTMNVFFRLGDELVTPPLDDTLLDGITRKTVITLAADLGIPVSERKVTVREVVEGAKNGKLKEAFGAGTAATIFEIAELGYEDKNFLVGSGSPDKTFSDSIGRLMQQIKMGTVNDTHNWIWRVGR